MKVEMITMYGYGREMGMPYDKAMERAKEELKKEGFGVLTEIDVRETLKKKLNVKFDRYVILGACNPTFAYKALQAEPDIGLMLPCNVILREKDGKTRVSAIVPSVAMGMIDNPKLGDIAKEVENKLKKVIDSI